METYQKALMGRSLYMSFLLRHKQYCSTRGNEEIKGSNIHIIILFVLEIMDIIIVYYFIILTIL